MLLRGDTEFTQTEHLDRWDAAGDIRFIFGIEAHETSRPSADDLPAEAYSLPGTAAAVSDQDRASQRPERVKAEIVAARVQDDPPAGGDGRRVRLSAGRVPARAIA